MPNLLINIYWRQVWMFDIHIISKSLHILIHVLILLPQLQQPLKQLHPLRLQLPGIHQLLVVLPPRAHIAFLRDELGGFAMVGFQEVDGFLPFGEPEFGLGHNALLRGDDKWPIPPNKPLFTPNPVDNASYSHLTLLVVPSRGRML